MGAVTNAEYYYHRKMIGFANGLDMGWKKKNGVKDDFKVFPIGKWKDKAAIS